MLFDTIVKCKASHLPSEDLVVYLGWQVQRPDRIAQQIQATDHGKVG
jgi:hypothetical protein